MYLMWNIQILILFRVYVYFYQPIICNSNQCLFPHICKCKYLVLPADAGLVAWNLIFSLQVRVSGIFKIMFNIILLFLLLTHLFHSFIPPSHWTATGSVICIADLAMWLKYLLFISFCCGSWNILFINTYTLI